MPILSNSNSHYLWISARPLQALDPKFQQSTEYLCLMSYKHLMFSMCQDELVISLLPCQIYSPSLLPSLIL